jgi:hypothetical protein
MDYQVKHDKNKERFIIESGGDTAFVSYSVYGDTINFNSTYTPSALRRKGLAKLLVEKAFEYARENNLKVTSGCSYVLTFVQQYEGYKELMK